MDYFLYVFQVLLAAAPYLLVPLVVLALICYGFEMIRLWLKF